MQVFKKSHPHAPRSKLQEQLAARLSGGHFRFLNERLYSQRGDASFKMMQAEPELWDAYHAGFRAQVAAWPANPLDAIIREIRQTTPKGCTIADFGCGEARLAAELSAHARVVHSFDLVRVNDRVTACDMARVPLPDASVDVAVFCLALMGTNYSDFLSSAARVLKPGGRLLIAEIKSRFETDSMGAVGGGGISAFLAAITARGFSLEKRDETSHRMFILLHWRKGCLEEASGRDNAAPARKLKRARSLISCDSGRGVDQNGEAPTLRKCVYKRR